ncbi:MULTISPECIES: hypothetical protein [Cyanophyceae]|uniref:hypothetical protein n=1 Tax=Cyanophyceae TaxID=3028117 RepID=UPI00016DCEAF|nr:MULTISPECIES: hypothetical protein [Cyanophyceae]ACB00969.1 hypothetical protein SYNPCC7002_F0038 [Picosynechococcus sp. PCC 7002]SMH58500.1 hypothetical protein SAMN06272755_3201 [Picosynechococcus sp. OG1]SMQ86449.1 hypothetical protein SAMN06272774_3193 [Synechococcus sp. 7002]
MISNYPTQSQYGPDLATLDHIEATGEVYHSWEVMELIQVLEQQVQEELEARDRQKREQQAQEELEALEQQKHLQQKLAELEELQSQKQDQQVLGEFEQQGLDTQSNDAVPGAVDSAMVTTYEEELMALGAHLKQHCQDLFQALTPITETPVVQFPSTPAEVQNHIDQIHQIIMPLLNLTYKYQEFLVATDRRDGITHCYYQRGLNYCANYLAQRATLATLTTEFKIAFRPAIALERIYRYLDQLPSLYYSLTNRLLQTLWAQISETYLPPEAPDILTPEVLTPEYLPEEAVKTNEILDA